MGANSLAYLIGPEWIECYREPGKKYPIPLDIYTALPYGKAVHTVIETPTFISKCRRYQISDSDREAIIDFVANNPDAGDLIKGSGGARKLRFAAPGRGKSGGYRVVTFYSGKDIPVFLLSIFAKSDKANLTDSEVKVLRTVLHTLANEYRRRTKP